MEKTGRYSRKGIRRLGSLLAACLWLWLPARATVTALEVDRQTYVSQTYVSTLGSQPTSDDTDLGSVIYKRDSVAFIGARSGHTFPPSYDWFPGLDAPVFRQLMARQPDHRGHPGVYPICLRSIFEHQIAINAP